MHAEIIAIGDELTSGQRLDTNSQWLSQRLGEMGIRTMYHSTVGDDLAANTAVFRTAAARASIVVCTGGLGPTADDLTREALAEAAGVPLRQDEDALQRIKSMFASRNREMPPQNVRQAMFPEGSQVVPNPHGTAPGIDFIWPERPDVRVFALPGVPAEMKEMWEQTVGPAIGEQHGVSGVIRHRVIKCFGIGESDLEGRLPDLIRRGRQPAVGITVHRATITLRISAQGNSADECERLIQPTWDTIHDCLGPIVFGYEEEQLEHAVVRLLAAQKSTVEVIESGTGGLLANWLASADPTGHVYLGGHVDRRLDGDAQAIRQLLSAREPNADYALAVGPFPAAPGEFLVGLRAKADDQIVVASRPYSGHPDILRERSAKQALDLLRLQLLNAE